MTCGLFFVPLGAAEFEWRGNNNDRWRTDANWSPDGDPGTSDTVVFGQNGNDNEINLAESSGDPKDRVVGEIRLRRVNSGGFNSWKFRNGTLQANSIRIVKPVSEQKNSEASVGLQADLVLPANHTLQFDGSGYRSGGAQEYHNVIRVNINGGVIGDATSQIVVDFGRMAAVRFSPPATGALSATFLGTLKVDRGRADIFDPDFLDEAAALEVNGLNLKQDENVVRYGSSVVFGGDASTDTFSIPKLSGTEIQNQNTGVWSYGQIRIPSPDATFVFGDTTDTSFAGLFQGPGTVRKVSSGTFSFGSPGRGEPHSATALLSGRVDDDDEVRPFTGTFEIDGGLVELQNGTELRDTHVQLDTNNGLSTLTTEMEIGGLSGSGNLGLSNKTLTIRTLNHHSYPGILSGTGTLKILGGGSSQTLTGVNTFTGTILLSGTLGFSADSAFGNSSNAITFQGGQLLPSGDFTSGREIFFESTNSTGNFNIPENTTTTWTGKVNATGTGNRIQKRGAGTLLLNNDTSTFAGELRILEGTAGTTSERSHDGVLVKVENNGTFEPAANSVYVGGLTGTGTVSIPAGRELFVNEDDSTTEFTGTLTGDGTLVKAGTGILTLNTATNSSTSLRVAEGTVDGDSTLGGIEVEASATLAPGKTGIGTISGSTGRIQGTLVSEINGADSDTLVLSGSLNLSDGTGVLDLQFPNGPPTQPAYVLVSYDSIQGTFSQVNNLPTGYGIQYDFNGSSIALVADNTPPELIQITRLQPGPNPSNGSSVTFVFSFSETVYQVDASDFAVSFPGTFTEVLISGSGSDRTLILNGISGSGILTVSVDAGNDIVDGAALNLAATSDSESITIDQEPPVMTLNGANPLRLNLGQPFVDPGASAVDNVDGSVAVTVSGSVNVSEVGSYTLTYEATDAALNAAVPVERTVIVTHNVTLTSVGTGSTVGPAGFQVNGTTDLPAGGVANVRFEDTSGSVETHAVVDSNGQWQLQAGDAGLDSETVVLAPAGKDRNPRLAALTGGGWVTTWFSPGDGSDGSDLEVFYQRFAADGSTVGSITQVDASDSLNDDFPAVAGLTDGGWVIVWTAHGPNGLAAETDVYLQRYNADGTLNGGNLLVNDTNAVEDSRPTVAGLADGGWAVVWRGFKSGDGTDAEHLLKRYDAAGVSADGVIQADDPDGPATDANARIAAIPGGGWLIADQGFDPVNGNWDVFWSWANASGVRQTGDISTNDAVGETNPETGPDVAVTQGGDFVITWKSGQELYMQLMSPQGTQIATGLVNPGLNSTQYPYGVTPLADGGFLIVWNSPASGNEEIYQRRYNALGAPVGAATQANLPSGAFDLRPSALGLPDGGWVITWENGSDIAHRRFLADGTPVQTQFDVSGLVEGTVTVTATVTDRFGESASDSTTTVYDATPPVIQLNGDATVDLEQGDPWVESASASDAVDGVVALSIGGDTLDPQIPGVYVLTYDAVDHAGNSATQQTRTVTVLSPYQVWVGGYVLPQGEEGLGDDPNEDGILNLDHFAHDSDPMGSNGDEGKRRYEESTVGVNSYFTLTLPIRTGAVFTGSPLRATVDGVRYEVVGFFDLTAGSTTVLEVTPALSTGLPPLSSADYEYRTFRLSTPATTGFLGIELTEIP